MVRDFLLQGRDCLSGKPKLIIKKIFPILLLVLAGCFSINNSNWDLYPEISKINLRMYIGKEVSIFLSDIEKQYDNYYFFDHPPGFLKGCSFHFKEYYIRIYNYPGNINKNEPKRLSEWKIDDFLKEKISFIEIVTWHKPVMVKKSAKKPRS